MRVANLTLSIDDETLRRARIRALEHGTSVNALVRDYLADYAGASQAAAALEEFLADSETWEAGSGPEGRAWAREDAQRG